MHESASQRMIEESDGILGGDRASTIFVLPARLDA